MRRRSRTLRSFCDAGNRRNLFPTGKDETSIWQDAEYPKGGNGLRDLNDLLVKIGSTFCGKPGNDKPTPATSLVIYKPGDVVTELPQVASNSATPPNTSTSPSSAPSVSREEADALLNQLSAEAKDAQANPDKKQAVQAKLAKAQSEFTWDYRFSYERAKLAVREGAPRRSLRSSVSLRPKLLSKTETPTECFKLFKRWYWSVPQSYRSPQNGKRYLKLYERRTASWSESNNHAPPYSTSHN